MSALRLSILLVSANVLGLSQISKACIIEFSEKDPTAIHFSLGQNSYYFDHVVNNKVVLPATAFIDASLKISMEKEDKKAGNIVSLRDLAIGKLLILRRDQPLVTLRVQADRRGRLILSQEGQTIARFTPHESASINLPKIEDSTEFVDHVSPELLYRFTRLHGLNYGSKFKLVSAANVYKLRSDDPDEQRLVLGRIKSNGQVKRPDEAFNPALMDAAFHLFAAAAATEKRPAERWYRPYVPVLVGRVDYRVQEELAQEYEVRMFIQSVTETAAHLDIAISDRTGQVVLHLSDVSLVKLDL